MKREWILYLVIFVLAFVLLKQCNSTPDPEVIEIIKEVVKTEYKTGKNDTIYLRPKKEIVIKWKTPDTIREIQFVKNEVSGSIDTIKTYETTISDSLIEGTIQNKVIGVLLNTEFKYKPLIQQINRVDTIRIEKETTIAKNKWALYAGGIVGGSLERFSLQPALLIKTNKNLQFSVGYEVIGQTYNVGVFTKIKNPLKK